VGVTDGGIIARFNPNGGEEGARKGARSRGSAEINALRGYRLAESADRGRSPDANGGISQISRGESESRTCRARFRIKASSARAFVLRPTLSISVYQALPPPRNLSGREIIMRGDRAVAYRLFTVRLRIARDSLISISYAREL